jgi:hypothetical protein
MVNSGDLIEQRTMLTNGYVSRHSLGVVAEYSGHFGDGYTIRRSNPNSDIYCFITYYIFPLTK